MRSVLHVAAVILAVAACGAGTQTKVDAPPKDDAVCKAELESTLDRTCTTPADCILVESEDCCGPIMLGIKTGTESSFPSKEQTYDVCLACPPLGCQHATQAENGMTAGNGQSIVADCVSGKCVSVVR